MDSLQQIEQLIESIKDDYQKGKGGNKAAGTRVRKTMQDVKNLAQTIRQEMLDARETADT
ncbi:MAG: histone H1 [Phycisphaerae bacterium]|nr:histone H1 [Phycisphaerae bacterium]